MKRYAVHLVLEVTTDDPSEHDPHAGQLPPAGGQLTIAVES